MHGLHREFPNQLCCKFGIHIRVISWTFFGRIMGRSRFNCLRGLYVSYGFICLCSFMHNSVLVSFELQSTRKLGRSSQDEVWLLIFIMSPSTYCLRDQKWAMCPLELYRSRNMERLGRFASSLLPSGFFNITPLALLY